LGMCAMSKSKRPASAARGFSCAVLASIVCMSTGSTSVQKSPEEDNNKLTLQPAPSMHFTRRQA
jgi:hypothetical protein